MSSKQLPRELDLGVVGGVGADELVVEHSPDGAPRLTRSRGALIERDLVEGGEPPARLTRTCDSSPRRVDQRALDLRDVDV